MSLPNQSNGKKSSNSSIANTPASTPVASNGNAQSIIQNSPPPNNNAPKYECVKDSKQNSNERLNVNISMQEKTAELVKKGTLVPNRIFVGGISANTTEGELLQLFSSYGTVKAAKIIQDRAGVSKGYGFITFESEDDAQRPLREADNIVLRERKLNIAPAVKKQPFNFNRAFDGASPTTVAVGNPQYFLPPTMPYFQGSVGYYAPPPSAPVPGDPNAQQPVYQPPPVYPPQTGPPQAATYPSMMFPAQTIYMPQQYPMAMPYEYSYYTNNGAPAQYMVGTQGGPGPQGPPLPPSGSPPRPPCYNQQVYTPDPVFYNVPVYGGPMDHPPVYTEPIETSGNYTEEPYMGQFVQQDIDARYNTRGTPCDSTTPVGEPHVQHNIPPSNNGPCSTPARYTSYTAAGEQHQQQRDFPTETDASRKTTTPVVSLLSVDGSAEKDYHAMQGGRKKKPLPVPTPPVNSHTVFAPFVNGMPPVPFPSMNYPPPPINYQPPTFTAPPFSTYLPPHQPPFNGVGQQLEVALTQKFVPKKAQTNGYSKKQTPSKSFVSKQNEISSNRSSLRTDSSSSTASVVEENRNHNEKLHRTNVNTPPPAPYSPLTNHGYVSRFNGVTSPPNGQYNNARPTRNFYNNHTQHDIRKLNVKPKPNSNFTARMNNGREISAEITNNSHTGESNQVNSTYDTNASQVHTGGSSSFAPLPSRRNRRSIRRSNIGTGAALSEIGAGDAPLPQNSDSVSETCKNLDSLKL